VNPSEFQYAVQRIPAARRSSRLTAYSACDTHSMHLYWGFLSRPMAAPTQRLEVTLDTQLESVDLAENIVVRVAEAAGFGEDDLHKLGMAVREGVINAYNYGNCQDRRKKIRLAVEFEAETMIVHVVDEGCGFELSDVEDPLAEENLLRTSGRGIFLMRAFMDDLAVRRAPTGGADLVMSKKLPHRVSGNGRPQAE
jgi:serine/threonine-protein kinase RsbW